MTSPNHPNTNVFSLDCWSRVDYVAIAYFFVNSLSKIVPNFYVVIPLLALNWSKVKENVLILTVSIAVFTTLILLTSIIKYSYYWFKVSESHVQIKSGVFKKSHLDLPFTKIQNIKIIEPIYYRPFKICLLELDTAGSTKQEAQLVAMSLDSAQLFKQTVLSQRVNDSEISDGSSNNEGQTIEKPREKAPYRLITRKLSDIALHGATNGKMFIVLGFLAPFYNLISTKIETFISNIGQNLDSNLSALTTSSYAALVAVLLTFGALILLICFSVLASIITFYNYQLYKDGNRYIRRCGLFTKHEVELLKQRIQLITIRQNFIDRLVGRYNYYLQQNASMSSSSSTQMGTNKLVVPSINRNEVEELCNEAYAIDSPLSTKFKRISRRYITQKIVFRCLPTIAVLYICMMVWLENNFINLAVLGSLLLIMLVTVIMSWCSQGYLFTNEYVFIRKGLLGVTYRIIPISKIQQIKITQAIWLEKKTLANIKFVTACGGYNVNLISSSDINKIKAYSLSYLAQLKPQWM